jgi:hypothetical protein
MMITSRTSLTKPPQTEGSPSARAIIRSNASTTVDVPSSRGVVGGRDGFERRLLTRLDELRGGEWARLPFDRLELRRLDARYAVALEPPSLDEHLPLE